MFVIVMLVMVMSVIVLLVILMLVKVTVMLVTFMLVIGMLVIVKLVTEALSNFSTHIQSIEVHAYNWSLLGVNQASKAEARRMVPDS